MRAFFADAGDEVLRRHIQQVRLADLRAEALGHGFRAERRPVGVGAQEHRAVVLGLAQAAEQVGTVDAGGAGAGQEVLVEAVVQRGRLLAADVLGIQAGLGRDHREHQLDAAPVQLPLHAAYQCPIVFQLLAARCRLELFVGEQPAVLADHHAGAAFVEQRVVECGPEVGAQALDREFLVVVGFEGVRQLAVEQWRIGRGGEARHALQRPSGEPQQQPAEGGDIGVLQGAGNALCHGVGLAQNWK